MCIAIVKPKGIQIPEEHLRNSWFNNNDGAGFACITSEGKFLIHKAMTYEGFIDIYRKAIIAYGETSDFLIHFRIASKGTTTLDNCHPFVIDEDRVLIHNGTLYNIAIDKDDKRSDTRIFAQDWLSQLPPNWEDNEIIQLMMEDFLGASKICMLHRTKGIYIFNTTKGVYSEGIWYSNSTYKRYVPYVVPDRKEYYSSTGAWNASGWDKSAPMYTKCDICNHYDTTVNMVDIKGEKSKAFGMVCYDCYAQLVFCDSCGKMCLDEEVDEYIIDSLVVPATICNDCVPNIPALIKQLEEDKEEEKNVANNTH